MRRSFLLLLMLLSMLFANSFVGAQTVSNPSIPQINKAIFQSSIEMEIKEAITQIYGEVYAPIVYEQVLNIAQKAIDTRPEVLKEEDLKRADDWYKDEIIYMFYVDQFGVQAPDKPNQFKDTAEMFEYLQDLGVTTLYL